MAGQESERQPLLQRRNTVIPETLEVPKAAKRGGGSDVRKWSSEPGYVSMKDLIAAAPPPLWVTSLEAVGRGEVKIRNRLLRLIAEAYLRPVRQWAEPRPRDVFHRSKLWLCFEFMERFLRVPCPARELSIHARMRARRRDG